jgi:hypothetical protein
MSDATFLEFVPEYRRRGEQHRDGYEPAAIDVNGLGQWLNAQARRGALPNFSSLRELIDFLDGRCASPSIRRGALQYWRTFQRWARAKSREATR